MVCSKCKVDKEVILFSVRTKNKSGYNDMCKQCQSDYHKNYYPKNKDKITQYKELNKDKITQYTKEYCAQYYLNNKPEPIVKQYIKKGNPDYYKDYFKKRYYNDINYKLAYILRSRFKSALNGNKKGDSTISLIGCSLNEFKEHIQLQLKPEMTWDNQGLVWEIDHILPCSSFNLSDVEQQKLCFNYTNLQPLFKTTSIAQSFGYDNHVGNRNKWAN